MSTGIILQQMGVIAIFVFIGIYMQKKDMIDKITEKKLSAIVIDIVNPALIMSCVLSGNIRVTHKELLAALGIGVTLYASLCLLGFFIPKVLPIEKKEQKFYNMMTVYTNVGFIGIPLAKAVLDENAMIYVIICNVMYCFLFYTHGIHVLSGKKEKIQIKKIFSTGTVMSILTLIIFWFDITLPPVVSNSIIYIGNAATFLSISLLGVSIAKSSMKDGIKDKVLWIYIGIRMLVLPILLVLILKILHFPKEMTQAFCLVASMPVGNLPLIQAEKAGEDTELLSRGIMLTTVVCLVTVTLLMSIMF